MGEHETVRGGESPASRLLPPLVPMNSTKSLNVAWPSPLCRESMADSNLLAASACAHQRLKIKHEATSSD